ncbi:RxLR effector protein [Phytophthora megakarya]|uniref:RxLR effector protein n=1 Tax=Phytophthora megakarya TaxID=4795 RepID=A0A225UW34_9STRA|nr:RxLR effector protein [Phytophthora megakarya]
MRLLLLVLLAAIITLCSSISALPTTSNLAKVSQSSSVGLAQPTANDIRHLRDGTDAEISNEERGIISSIKEVIRRIATAIQNKLNDLQGKLLNWFYFELYKEGITPEQLNAYISTKRKPKKYDIVKNGYPDWYKMKTKLDEANGYL